MTYRLPSTSTLLLTAVIALVASGLLALSHPVQMIVNGRRVVSDVPPITTVGNVAYVPLRSIAQALGASIIVHGSSVLVVRDKQSLRLIVGSRLATLNGMPMTLRRAPFRVRDRVMVTTHAIARAFGVYIDYNVRTARIDVITPGIGQAAAAAPPPTQ